LLKGAVVDVVEVDDVDDVGLGPAKAEGASSPVVTMVAETATPKALVRRWAAKGME
jgi:hypothetical protein